MRPNIIEKVIGCTNKMWMLNQFKHTHENLID